PFGSIEQVLYAQKAGLLFIRHPDCVGYVAVSNTWPPKVTDWKRLEVAFPGTLAAASVAPVVGVVSGNKRVQLYKVSNSAADPLPAIDIPPELTNSSYVHRLAVARDGKQVAVAVRVPNVDHPSGKIQVVVLDVGGGIAKTSDPIAEQHLITDMAFTPD